MSIYKGKKRFDRQQLNFIVEVMICSAIDSVEEGLPTTVKDQVHYSIDERINALHYAMRNLSWGFSILYAQLTGDGMANCDVPFIKELQKQINSLIEERFSTWWGGFRVGESITKIDSSELARKMVSACFGEYLND